LAKLRHCIAVPDLPDELDGIDLRPFAKGVTAHALNETRYRFKDLDPSYPSETVINAWVPGAKI
jgi:hypothetical protein